MGDKDTPAWGSPEFNKAIEEHDAQADPKREASGQKYTKKPEVKPAGKAAAKEEKKPAAKSQPQGKKGSGGKKNK
jgi:hypothetical protein